VDEANQVWAPAPHGLRCGGQVPGARWGGREGCHVEHERKADERRKVKTRGVGEIGKFRRARGEIGEPRGERGATSHSQGRGGWLHEKANANARARVEVETQGTFALQLQLS